MAELSNGAGRVARSPAMRRGAAAASVAVLLSLNACSWLTGEKDAPLPGERIPVVLADESVQPDASTRGEPVQLPPAVPNAAWPMAGGYASHAMHHLAAEEVLERVWSSDIGSNDWGSNFLLAQPVVGGGAVYTMDADAAVTAFDAKTGARRWRVDLTPDDESGATAQGGVAVLNDTVYASTGYGEVIALDAGSGAIRWRRQVGTPIHAGPTVATGVVVVVTIDNEVVALSSGSGDPLWQYAGLSQASALLGGAAPAIDAGTAVAGLTSGELVALTATGGALLWTDSLLAFRHLGALSDLSDIRGRPVIDRGLVLAISSSGRLAALDLVSGGRLWERSIGGVNSPWVAGNYVYVISNEMQLICLSRASGRIRWVTQLRQFEDEEDREDRILWTGPILVSDRLIVAGSHGLALAVSPYTGEPLGQISLPGPVFVPPVVADGWVYFLTDSADLVAYR